MPLRKARKDDTLIGTLLASTLRGSTPLILCALAGTMSERAGVIDLGLEGKMLMTAFTAASVGTASGSLWVALTAAVMVGVARSMLHACARVSHRGDQAVRGRLHDVSLAGEGVLDDVADVGLVVDDQDRGHGRRG